MGTVDFYLSGGVGNQLFGIYAGLYFQEKNRIKTKFIYQTYGSYSYESCLGREIDFNISYKIERGEMRYHYDR